MLQIKDYEKVFKLREAERHDEVTWGRFPCARASSAYSRLMQTAAGRTAFCVFVGAWRLATRNRTGGVLVLKGKPITPKDISDETGIPKSECAKAFQLLSSVEIGWFVPVSEPGENRFQNGFETGEKRFENGSKPLQEQEAEKEEEKDKGNAHRARSDTGEPEPPNGVAPLLDSCASRSIAHCRRYKPRGDVLPHVQHLAARIGRIASGGILLYDEGASRAIASELSKRRDVLPDAQLDWAIETMRERNGTLVIDNRGAYFRKLLTKEKPPAEWLNAWNRARLDRQLAAMGGEA